MNSIDITTIIKDIITFKVASDKPKTVKYTSLQLPGISFKLFNKSSFVSVPVFILIHPEKSEKIPFSIPR